MIDPLAQVVTLLRPETVMLTEICGTGEWGIDFPAYRVPNFAIVAEGECWVRLGENDPVPFRAGDFLMQPDAGEFGFSSEPSARAVFADASFKASAGNVIVLGQTDGSQTRIIGGHFKVDQANNDLFASLLPRSIHIRAIDTGAEQLSDLIRLIAVEARVVRPGRALVLPRLAEVMVVEALRFPAAQGPAAPPGLLAGLADRHLAAVLQAIHSEAGQDWKLSKFAQIAGLSRAAFARRFNDVVGSAPMTYLLRWRMALSKSALRHEGITLDEIAKRTGYASAAAFSHAFLRTVGCTPSFYRKVAIERDDR